jgi:hypothetical protein
MKLDLHGFIKDGKLHISNRRLLEAELATQKDMDVTILIKKRGKRSLPQNAYYWSTIVPEVRIALREKGARLDMEQTHEFLKFHFNKQYIHGEGGEVISEYGGSTTSLNKTEFSEYIERIMIWSAEKLQLAISPAGTQTSFFDKAA